MSINLIRLTTAITAILALSVTISCAPSHPTATPVNQASSQNSRPAFIDMVGSREWKPMQEGPLQCVSEEEGNLAYAWSADKGTIKGEGKQVTWVAPDSPGEYVVTVKVTNPKGKETIFKRSFKVTDNPYNNNTPDRTIYLQLFLPSGYVVTEKSHPRIWTTTEIECVVPGADESNLSYQWTAPTGKLAGNGLAEGKAKRVGWIAPGVGGQYTVSVIVTDKSGNKATGEVNFDVYCCKE